MIMEAVGYWRYREKLQGEVTAFLGEFGMSLKTLQLAVGWKLGIHLGIKFSSSFFSARRIWFVVL